MKLHHVAGGLATLLLAGPAQAQTTEWTLGYVALKGTIYAELAEAIPARIEAATGGKLKITANSSLVPGNRLLEGVRDGLIQMTVPIPAYYTGTEPLFTIHSLPGISESYDDLKALAASDIGAQITGVYAETYGATQLMETAFCPQTLFSTAPMTTLEEWKDKKLRVNNRGIGIMGAELGATTVQLSAGEVLPALERGVIEAVMTDSCWAYGAGFGSVVTHAADWKLGSVLPAPVLVNTAAWQGLPDDVRAAAKAEFAKLQGEFETRWRDQTAQLPELWQKSGIDFAHISDEETARAYDPAIQTPVLEVWRADMTRVGLDADAVLDQARQAVE